MKDKPSLPPDSRPQFPHLHSTNFPNRHVTPSDFERSDSTSIQESVAFTPNSESEPPFPFHDFLNEEISSNTPDLQVPNSNTNRANPGLLQHQPHYSGSPQNVNNQNNYLSLSNFTAGAELSHSRAQPLESHRQIAQPGAQTHQQYNSQLLLSPPQRNTNPMQHPLYATQCPPHQQAMAPHPSAYPPFQTAFPDSTSAQVFRNQATRFDRIPYQPPDQDPTIQFLKNNRQLQVKRIYDAMTRSDAAKDNEHSIAMRRWVESPQYDPMLVEAYAHKVFDCLIEQVEKGYRGWPHNDYASDDRKGEPEDKSVSAAERLDNIIRGLEQEKTICEDIMASACQIRMFVNAPRAYARRKEANRHGNSKRGKAAPVKPDSGRQTRAKRARDRQTARQRNSATPSYVSASASATAQLPLRDIEPNFQSQNFGPQPPYYTTPGPAPHLQAVPQQHPDAPHHEAAFNGLGNYHSSPLSPPQPHANGPNFTASTSPLPPQHPNSSYLSPPPMSHGSLPTSPVGYGYTGIGFHGTHMQSHAGTPGPVGSSWPPTDWHDNLFAGDQAGQPRAHDIFQNDQHPGAPGLDINWNLRGFDVPQTGHPGAEPHAASAPMHGMPIPGSGSGSGHVNGNGGVAVDPNASNIDPGLHIMDYWSQQHNVQAFPGTQGQKSSN